MSDFLQRINKDRALEEGELERTLMSLKEVSAARVHIHASRSRLRLSPNNPSRAASVVLQLNPPGTTLSRERVAAVRTFVAGAIGAKSQDSVTIIDQDMNLLTGPTMNEPGKLQPSQEEARRNTRSARRPIFDRFWSARTDLGRLR